ncbi:MAG: HU family DNA-binding protein [Mycobacteriales bacterium]
MCRLNKSELIEAVTGRLGEGRSVATRAVDAVFDEIMRTVSKGERVAVTGFGVFEKRDRAARIARNPATGATVKVKKTSVPAFRAGQGFKDVVTGARKLAKVAAPVAARATSAARSTAAKATRPAAKPAAKAAAKRVTKAAPARSAAKPAAKKTAAKPAAAKKAAAKPAAAKKAAAKKATKR